MRRTIPLAATAILLTIGVGAAVALAAPTTDDAPDRIERGDAGADRPGGRSGPHHDDGDAGRHHGPAGDGQHGDHAAHAVTSELDFLTHMIPHHEEAVEAAQQLQAYSEREEMQDFAALIIEVQQDEIAQMRGWLDEWYGDDTHDADYEPMMRDLTGLEPDEVDRVFLEDMIPHHMSAVMMSMQLLNRDLVVNDDIIPFAQQIADDQRTEIMQMRRWLAEWYDAEPMGRMQDGAASGDGCGHRAGDGPGARRSDDTPHTQSPRQGAAEGRHGPEDGRHEGEHRGGEHRGERAPERSEGHGPGSMSRGGGPGQA